MVKRVKPAAFLLLVLSTLGGAPNVAAQFWRLTSAPSNDWVSVASSADGHTLIACAGPSGDGLIYVSTNAGTDWAASTAPVRRWASVASSADGAKFVAAFPRFDDLGGVWRSIDAGATWGSTGAPTTNVWNWVSSSAEGSTILACDPPVGHYSSRVFFSSDAGGDWGFTFFDFQPLCSAVCSADGQKWIAATPRWGTYTSTNQGQSWLHAALNAEWTALAASADGEKIAGSAAGYANGVYVSKDSGATWKLTSAPIVDWAGIASTADGQQLVAVGNSQPIYWSTDSGATWQPMESQATNWHAAASSADGCRLVAAVQGGGIYLWEAIPRPALCIRSENNKCSVSWLTPSTPFILQQTTSLTRPQWTDIDVQPALNYTNLNQEVILPAPSGPMFYRLVSR